MFKVALFAVDGSDSALGAMPALLQAADLEQTSIVVLQVIDSVQRVLAHEVPPPIGRGRDPERVVAEQRASAESHLASVALDLAQAGARRVETVVREGRAGEQIVNLAEERDAEVVVMATHGRSGLRRAVMGSVADHVLRHLEGVPLLLVRPVGG